MVHSVLLAAILRNPSGLLGVVGFGNVARIQSRMAQDISPSASLLPLCMSDLIQTITISIDYN